MKLLDFSQKKWDHNCFANPTDAASHNARSINRNKFEFFSFYLTKRNPFNKPYQRSQRCPHRERYHSNSRVRSIILRTRSSATWKRAQNGPSSSAVGMGCRTGIIYCEKISVFCDTHWIIVKPRQTPSNLRRLFVAHTSFSIKKQGIFAFPAFETNLVLTRASIMGCPWGVFPPSGFTNGILGSQVLHGQAW